MTAAFLPTSFGDRAQRTDGARRLGLVAALLGFGWSAAAGAACDSLASAHWLPGSWESASAKSITVETWRRATDTTFEGLGERRSAETGETVSSESLRLVEMEGEVFYLAKVAHNPWPVPFRLVVCDDDRLVFENAGHDFPTRLVYRREGEAGLTVEVSGADGEGFSLRFKRKRAPGESP